MMNASAYDSVLSAFRTLFPPLIADESAPTFLVALSGGADSSLLLHLMKAEGYTIAAAHLNHGIRGEEADRDEAFCRNLCHTLNIPFFSKRVDIPSLAKARKSGLEETARTFRYAFLRETAKEKMYSHVVTAHNADDNAETVLFHLSRGSGLRGLCGIPPRRDNILRPLLSCSKETILAACLEKGIPFVTDSTNDDCGYTRNFLRHEVIPLLRQINPSVCESIFTTSSLLREDEEYLSDRAATHSLQDGRTALSCLPDSLLSRILIKEFEKGGIRAEHRHIKEAMNRLRSDDAVTRLSLPGGTLSLDRDIVRIENSDDETLFFDFPLHLGINEIDHHSCLYLCFSEEECLKDINKLKNIYKFETKGVFCSATMDRSLRARSRQPGDTLRSGGLTRRVKKMLQSLKSPLQERNRLPFITDGSEVLWVPGLPIADSARPVHAQSILTILYFTK